MTELEAAIRRARRTREVAETLPEWMRGVDRHFLAHLIVAHGLPKHDALARGADHWREWHDLQRHEDHHHG